MNSDVRLLRAEHQYHVRIMGMDLREFKASSITEYVAHIEKLSLLSTDFWFRGVAKANYKPVPGIIWKNATEYEGSLEHHFLIGHKSYIDTHGLGDWETFALMQHHGLPTRLLDWSESALVALYFALTSEPSSNAYRVVWVLNPYALNKATIGRDFLYCPAAMNNRSITANSSELNLNSYLPPNLQPENSGVRPEHPIAINSTQHLKRVSSQKGCFTVHGSKTQSIDTYLKADKDFHMIKIDARTKKARKDLLTTLSLMGINEEFIFQDLDSLCNRIKREWNVL